MPKGLPVKIGCSKHHRKSLSLLFCIKAHCDAGRFKKTKILQQHYAGLARICYNTFLTHLVHLGQLGLVKVEGGYLYLASWEQIADKFELKGTLRFYHISSPTGKTKLEDILESLAMREVMDKNKAAFYFYLLMHPEVKETLQRVVGSANRSDVLRSQLENFLTAYGDISKSDAYDLTLFRADNNVSYRYWSHFFVYNSKGGFAYKKRKLEALNLIEVERERKAVLNHHTRRDSRRCILGSVNWDSRIKKPVLTLPDAISFNALKNAA